MRKSVLWIEDGAFDEITVLATPVHLAGVYHLEFAFSATEGIQQLERKEFDAIVVDIRIPPGDDPRWAKVHYSAGASNRAARLGLKLLEFVLGDESDWNRDLPDASKDRKRYGVLSMERWRDIEKDLGNVGVTRHRDKGSGDDPEVLLRIIQDILEAA